jgi:hypothetical protein
MIAKTSLLILSVDPNISNKVIDTILEDKFWIKPQSMQL